MFDVNNIFFNGEVMFVWEEFCISLFCICKRNFDKLLFIFILLMIGINVVLVNVFNNFFLRGKGIVLLILYYGNLF